MTEHYYSQQPSVKHDMHKLKQQLRGREFDFMTDAGVFSKKEVDFGSRLLIENMEIPENAKVLDVGCGYGPIGLVAAHLAAKGFVTMVDINERAIELARKNAERNLITNVEIKRSDLLTEVGDADYDRVLTNPPIRAGKETVHRIFSQAKEHLVENGELWVVIQKKQGAPSALDKLTELYRDVYEVCKRKGYRIFKAIK